MKFEIQHVEILIFFEVTFILFEGNQTQTAVALFDENSSICNYVV